MSAFTQAKCRSYYRRQPCLKTGKQIREFRIARGLTQLELSQRADVSEVLVGRLEHGGSVGLDNFERVLEALNIKMTLSNQPQPEMREE